MTIFLTTKVAADVLIPLAPTGEPQAGGRPVRLLPAVGVAVLVAGATAEALWYQRNCLKHLATCRENGQ